MDLNAVYECIGYGASRAVSSDDFHDGLSHVPARYIIETAKDPVEYCLTAYALQNPGFEMTLTRKGRAFILKKLEHEAGFSSH